MAQGAAIGFAMRMAHAGIDSTLGGKEIVLSRSVVKKAGPGVHTLSNVLCVDAVVKVITLPVPLWAGYKVTKSDDTSMGEIVLKRISAIVVGAFFFLAEVQ